MQAALDGAIHRGRGYYIRPILIQSTQDAVALRNTICCSSVDNGSSDLRPQNGGLSDNLNTCSPSSFQYLFLGKSAISCLQGRKRRND